MQKLPLCWEQDSDEFGNDYWWAPYPYRNDDSNLRFLIEKNYKGSHFIDRSDPEIRILGCGNVWNSIEDAKECCQLLSDRIFDEEKFFIEMDSLVV